MPVGVGSNACPAAPVRAPGRQSQRQSQNTSEGAPVFANSYTRVFALMQQINIVKYYFCWRIHINFSNLQDNPNLVLFSLSVESKVDFKDNISIDVYSESVYVQSGNTHLAAMYDDLN